MLKLKIDFYEVGQILKDKIKMSYFFNSGSNTFYELIKNSFKEILSNHVLGMQALFVLGHWVALKLI